MSLHLASIHLYPVKSLGGFATDSAQLTDRGLQHDRRWMLVDEQGKFLSQRELAAMACLHCSPADEGFRVHDLRDGASLQLPWSIAEGEKQRAQLWSATLPLLHGEPAWDAWFSAQLERPVRLVYMPDASKRRTDGRYAKGLTALSDAFPYLIISQASLDDLNTRLPEPVGMERFRPNLVIAGGVPYQEDDWKEILIGEPSFEIVKACARCVIITTDQNSGERNKEPLRSLAKYRARGNKVRFGMYAMANTKGSLRVGDVVSVG